MLKIDATTGFDAISGDRYRASHQASVDSILGSKVRTVRSEGHHFLNRDTWTVHPFVEGICKSTATDLDGRVRDGFDSMNRARDRALNNYHFKPEILIAATPEVLPFHTALALTGGAYHEALHTEFSSRIPFRAERVDFIDPLWNKYGDKLFRPSNIKLILAWCNFVEDIRIERLGCKKYPGIPPKLVELQDFILRMEQPMYDGKVPPNPALITQCVFRDLGLGYQSTLQKERNAYHEEKYPEVWAFVNGPLSPMLDEAIGLKAKDDLGCLRLALQVIGTILDAADEDQQPEDDQEPEEQEKSQPGQGSPKDEDSEEKKEGDNADKPQGSKGKGQKDQEGEKDEESGTGKGAQQQGKSDPQQGEDEASPGSGESMELDLPPNFLELAQEILSQDGAAMDAAAAFEAAFKDERDREHTDRQRDVKDGEQPYIPHRIPVTFVNLKDNSGDASRLLDAVKSETVALRSKLRTLVLAQEMADTVFGVHKGRGLSARHLVDTKAALMQGDSPTSAYWDRTEGEEVSTAVCMILDTSGSTQRYLQDLVQGLLAILDPLERLGCATMAFSFVWNNTVELGKLKDWHEPFSKVKGRFGALEATGGTPTAEGLYYAIKAIEKRPEGRRLIFVVTDGEADDPQTVRWLTRRAKEAGIYVIGVGVTEGARNVTRLFEDHVYVPRTSELPKVLVKTLTGAMDKRSLNKRGQRAKL